MPRRRKTRFEHWFSLSRHRRRAGAAALAQSLGGRDVQELKNTLVQGAAGESAQYQHGSLVDLRAHLDRLRLEFIGQPELLYHHAALIVMIRREAQVREHFALLRELWLAESEFFCASLDMRWLVAACDTFIDHDADPVVRATLMNGVLLVNTIKLQETERFLAAGHPPADDPDARAALHAGRVALFDGLAAFVEGADDTLRNMRWRLDQVCALHPLGVSVMEIFERLQRAPHDNVYFRFRQRHTRDRTAWW